MKPSIWAFMWFAALAVVNCSNFVFAGNSALDASADATERNQDGGFLELGISVISRRAHFHDIDPLDSGDVDLEIEFSVSAGYRYKNLFIEGTDDYGFDGLNVGMTLAEFHHWDVDLLLANMAGTVTIESDEPPPPETEAERNSAILERDSLFIAAGPRITGYYNDTIFQFRLVADWYEGNGFLGGARVGRQWQVGNYNMQAIAGARYYSQDYSDYRYGISVEEQSERFPAYRASSAWIPELEFGLSKPIRRDWVFRSRIGFRHFPDSISESPLASRDTDIVFTNGIHYVF